MYLLVTLGVLASALIASAVIFALPPEQYVLVGEVSDFPPAIRPYQVQNNRSLYLVNTGAEILAFTRFSPTRTRCLFNWAVQEATFIDPCSGSQFTLNGNYFKGPAARNLDQYPVHIENGMVQVDLSRLLTGERIR